MHDLTPALSLTLIPRLPPKGLAFEIADLILIHSWAASHDVSIVVRLDHGADDEEYEEVVTFRTETPPLSQMILWRSAEAVFIQPLVGRTQYYDTVADALSSLQVEPPVILTDIVATTWPSDARSG